MNHHNNSVSLASIVIDKRFQTRVAMDQGAIADYADAIRQAGVWPFPPIKVVRQVLVDGFHRIEAARRVIAAPETPADLRKALQAIPCERVAVDPANNDISDLALQHALAANHTHGLRPSNADKRRAVELALDMWPDKSDREIAKLTQTSHTFASTVRGELQVATLPRESEPESALDDLREVATLPRAKQRACGGSDEHRPNPEEAAKKVRSIADQHRDKLVRAIDDYHEHKPNARERDRLVKLVQGVDLW
jgi:hypothetical protein